MSAKDVSEMEEFLTKDMREHPENWLWIWDKVIKWPTARSPEEAKRWTRRFWGLPRRPGGGDSND